MNDKDFRDVLHEALVIYIEEGEEIIKRIETFEEAGVITANAGLVIKTKDGSKFQVTIVQSK